MMSIKKGRNAIGWFWNMDKAFAESVYFEGIVVHGHSRGRKDFGIATGILIYQNQ